MADAPYKPVTVQVDEDLIFQIVGVFEKLEGWIDGACTAAGAPARGPDKTLAEMDELLEQLHLLTCPNCAAAAASGPAKPRHKPTGEKVIVLNGGKPPTDKGVH